MPLRVGIDFDNTIVCFDEVFFRYALEQDLVDESVVHSKNAIREEIRMKKGNAAWTMLQSIVYSEGLAEATMADGCEACLAWLRDNHAELFVISHKTAHAAAGEGVELRTPALEWLTRHGFFAKDRLNLNQDKNVFFEDTRIDKLKRIRRCRLTHFIDDLEEVFREPEFPSAVTKILYGQDALFFEPESKVLSFTAWSGIEDYFKNPAPCPAPGEPEPKNEPVPQSEEMPSGEPETPCQPPQA